MPKGQAFGVAVLALAASVVLSFGGQEHPPSAAAASPTNVLAALATSLAGTTNVQASFEQRKRLSLLDREVVIKGTLAVQSPDRLAWHVTEPIRFSIVLSGSVLQQWDEDTKTVQRIPLAGKPMFAVVTRLLRGGLGGDIQSLLDDFDPRILATEPVQIEFVPKTTSFANKAVRRIVLTLREDRRYVQAILIEQLDGDRTAMSFSDTRLNSTIDPVVWEVEPRGK